MGISLAAAFKAATFPKKQPSKFPIMASIKGKNSDKTSRKSTVSDRVVQRSGPAEAGAYEAVGADDKHSCTPSGHSKPGAQTAFVKSNGRPYTQNELSKTSQIQFSKTQTSRPNSKSKKTADEKRVSTSDTGSPVVSQDRNPPPGSVKKVRKSKLERQATSVGKEVEPKLIGGAARRADSKWDVKRKASAPRQPNPDKLHLICASCGEKFYTFKSKWEGKEIPTLCWKCFDATREEREEQDSLLEFRKLEILKDLDDEIQEKTVVVSTIKTNQQCKKSISCSVVPPAEPIPPVSSQVGPPKQAPQNPGPPVGTVNHLTSEDKSDGTLTSEVGPGGCELKWKGFQYLIMEYPATSSGDMMSPKEVEKSFKKWKKRSIADVQARWGMFPSEVNRRGASTFSKIAVPATLVYAVRYAVAGNKIKFPTKSDLKATLEYISVIGGVVRQQNTYWFNALKGGEPNNDPYDWPGNVPVIRTREEFMFECLAALTFYASHVDVINRGNQANSLRARAQTTSRNLAFLDPTNSPRFPVLRWVGNALLSSVKSVGKAIGSAATTAAQTMLVAEFPSGMVSKAWQTRVKKDGASWESRCEVLPWWKSDVFIPNGKHLSTDLIEFLIQSGVNPQGVKRGQMSVIPRFERPPAKRAKFYLRPDPVFDVPVRNEAYQPPTLVEKSMFETINPRARLKLRPWEYHYQGLEMATLSQNRVTESRLAGFQPFEDAKEEPDLGAAAEEKVDGMIQNRRFDVLGAVVSEQQVCVGVVLNPTIANICSALDKASVNNLGNGQCLFRTLAQVEGKTAAAEAEWQGVKDRIVRFVGSVHCSEEARMGFMHEFKPYYEGAQNGAEHFAAASEQFNRPGEFGSTACYQYWLMANVYHGDIITNALFVKAERNGKLFNVVAKPLGVGQINNTTPIFVYSSTCTGCGRNACGCEGAEKIGHYSLARDHNRGGALRCERKELLAQCHYTPFLWGGMSNVNGPAQILSEPISPGIFEQFKRNSGKKTVPVAFMSYDLHLGRVGEFLVSGKPGYCPFIPARESESPLPPGAIHAKGKFKGQYNPKAFMDSKNAATFRQSGLKPQLMEKELMRQISCDEGRGHNLQFWSVTGALCLDNPPVAFSNTSGNWARGLSRHYDNPERNSCVPDVKSDGLHIQHGCARCQGCLMWEEHARAAAPLIDQVITDTGCWAERMEQETAGADFDPNDVELLELVLKALPLSGNPQFRRGCFLYYWGRLDTNQRGKYKQGWQDLVDGKMTLEARFRMSMFVKFEKKCTTFMCDVGGDEAIFGLPRLVCPSDDPGDNVAMGPFGLLIQKGLTLGFRDWVEGGFVGPPPILSVSSGSNAYEIGRWYGWCLDNGFNFLEDDFSRLDSRHGPGFSTQADRLMVRMVCSVRGMSPTEINMLRKSRIRLVKTPWGVFTLDLALCSGFGLTFQANTAGCSIAVYGCFVVVSVHGVPKRVYELYLLALGDDSLLAVRGYTIEELRQMGPRFAKRLASCGLKAKTVACICPSFCSQIFWPIKISRCANGVWGPEIETIVMAPEIARFFSRFGATFTAKKDKSQFTVAEAIALSFGIILSNAHFVALPILRVFHWYYHSVGTVGTVPSLEPHQIALLERGDTRYAVSDFVAGFLKHSYGWDAGDVLSFEKRLWDALAQSNGGPCLITDPFLHMGSEYFNEVARR